MWTEKVSDGCGTERKRNNRDPGDRSFTAPGSEEYQGELSGSFFHGNFMKIPIQKIMSGLFLVFYLLIVIPTALYTGAIAFNKIFNLETIFGLSYAQAIVYTVIAIGVVGAIYAIFGGLKAVAVSDTINAVILVIGALLVPVFALLYLGNGSISEGLNIITTTHVENGMLLVVQPTLPLGQQSLPVLWSFTSSIGQQTKQSYNVV